MRGGLYVGVCSRSMLVGGVGGGSVVYWCGCLAASWEMVVSSTGGMGTSLVRMRITAVAPPLVCMMEMAVRARCSSVGMDALWPVAAAVASVAVVVVVEAREEVDGWCWVVENDVDVLTSKWCSALVVGSTPSVDRERLTLLAMNAERRRGFSRSARNGSARNVPNRLSRRSVRPRLCCCTAAVRMAVLRSTHCWRASDGTNRRYRGRLVP